jgi:CheY-like chemotaxis protein
VFEPFFTTKEKGKGTGLGLSMVYGFIKQSRGHINLYSEPGHGTTVRIYLPRAEGGPNDRAILDRHWQRVGGDETILLVEDDELVRRYVQQQIESLGYRVLAAADGPAALAILRERSDIMLLFTDIVMPGGMTGRALAEAARALRPDLRILYTSGYTDSAIGRHDRFDAEIPLLSKPYRSADLAQYIREALE